MSGRSHIAVLGAALVALLATAATGEDRTPSDDNAALLVKARQGGMTMSVMTLGTIAAASGSEESRKRSAFPASGLAKFATALPALFAPETKGIAGSRALSTVWDNWDAFLAQVVEFREAAAALSAAAGADDRPAFDAALARTRAACQSCHETFRAEAA